ncbi:30S ribosomal protein S8e [Candidatus Woesearchaeota archaeon]|jgi:small subunit ribosomal protein S8e|nr:30S ribosomal protein S8e [Candidatus Woesearchaeota archaeon]MBT4368429.1 30S ribosomal protein S8e [Candidatus Woesearchaeota archaeon]MBT4712918.1 30S ribosomal protein S8e [Candidatus Woesearchaeota archaeon]MBT6639830.1 30S ribosomal protein S8e [Candidatus Woesearchaeota archaeon]MBT7134002.1 30S ribosomal protein S8e [Candidatus Woesearchaeota archaeon]
MISRKRSKRKSSGGLYTASRKKRKSELGSVPTTTKLGEVKRRLSRVLGGNVKTRNVQTNVLNLFDGKTYVKATIKNVTENSANKNFIRQNILTKGAIVETDKGKAKITSRPGQTGSLNGILIK